jgi:F-type H+-transporting ATPase subunit delta
MKNSILANRYAKALFSVAQEENAFDEYAKSLSEVAAAISAQPEVKDGVTNPMYPVDVRCKVMAYIAETIGASQVIKNFLDLVLIKKRAAFIPDIAEAFQVLIDTQRNICQGTVVSAMPLSPELSDKLQTTLEKITGKKVVLSTKVDPSIVGGLIAKVGDLVLDGSIRSQLQGLKESIKGSE